jgi:ferredoxin
MNRMRVNVNFETCQSLAVCMGTLPEVFEVRDDGFLYILNETPDESLRASVEECVRNCPTDSISITEG